MNKQLSLLLLLFILFICIGIIIFLIHKYKQKRFSIFKEKRYIFTIIILFFLLPYSIWVYSRMLILGKLENFGEKISIIIGEYKTANGIYPKNIRDLNNFDKFVERKSFLLFPVDHELGFVGTIKGDKFQYILYAYGFDNTDDKLEKSYPINYIYAFIPNIRGDIIIKQSWIKESDTVEIPKVY